jgi:hypothetical protein
MGSCGSRVVPEDRNCRMNVLVGGCITAEGLPIS